MFPGAVQTKRREPAGAICVPVFKPLLLQVKQLQSPPMARSGKWRSRLNCMARLAKAL
jgi:hypothetical protein